MQSEFGAQTIARQQARDRSPIESLIPEILGSIFEFIYITSPATVTALTLVDKSFYNAAAGFRWHHQHFHFEISENDPYCMKTQVRINTLLEDTERQSWSTNTRHITVSSDGPYGPIIQGTTVASSARPFPIPDKADPKSQWVQVSELVSKIKHLRSLTFKAHEQMPLCLIESLARHHPSAHLHVENWTRISKEQHFFDPAEIALANSINLRSIKANVGRYQAALKRIIATAPQLQDVEINTSLDFGFHVYQEHKKAALYRHEGTSKKVIKSLRGRGFDYVRMLQDVIDISKLQTLEMDTIPFGGFSTYNATSTMFECLSHLSINIHSFRSEDFESQVEKLQSFLESCIPLQSLSIQNGAEMMTLSPILERHGPSLIKLGLHEIETLSIDNLRKPMSVENLEEINRVCPLLQDLAIDINRSPDGISERALFIALSEFKNLKIIRLSCDLGIAYEAYHLPRNLLKTPMGNVDINNPFERSNSAWRENTWSVLQKERAVRGTAPLRKLHLVLGEQERDVGPEPWTEWVVFEREMRARWLVVPSERDDWAGYIEIWGEDSAVEGKVKEVRMVPWAV